MPASQTDEFDDWLVAAAPPVPPAPRQAAPTEPAPAASASSWFSGLSSAAEKIASGRGIAVPSTLGLSVPSAQSSFGALTGLGSKLKATIESNVKEFQEEANRYCADSEASRAEIAELSQLVAKVGQTVTLAPTGAAVDGPPSSLTAAVTPPPAPVESLSWLEAPGHLSASLEQAVLRLSEEAHTFLEPPDLPPVPVSAGPSASSASAAPPSTGPPSAAPPSRSPSASVDMEELSVLHRCARAALAFDPRLAERRFELVRPSKLTETQFWDNYWRRVLRERRLLMLPPLRGPSGPAGGSATDPNFHSARASAVAATPAQASAAEVAMEAERLLDLSDADTKVAGFGGRSGPAAAPLPGGETLADLEAEADRLLELGSLPLAPLPPPTPAIAAAANLAIKATPIAAAPARNSPFQDAHRPPPAQTALPETPPSKAPSATPVPPTPATAMPAGPLRAAWPPPEAHGSRPAERLPTVHDELDAKIAAELDGLDEDEDFPDVVGGSSGSAGASPGAKKSALLKAEEEFDSLLDD